MMLCHHIKWAPKEETTILIVMLAFVLLLIVVGNLDSASFILLYSQLKVKKFEYKHWSPNAGILPRTWDSDFIAGAVMVPI